jgi:DNA-binding transcriptional regulator YdaS (Cro superfamily)
MEPYLVSEAVTLPQFDGNQSRFASAISTTQQNVSNWVRKRKPLPAEFVLSAEKATGISRHVWRPDIYPAERAAA